MGKAFPNMTQDTEIIVNYIALINFTTKVFFLINYKTYIYKPRTKTNAKMKNNIAITLQKIANFL